MLGILFVYVLGGITFLPLLAVTFVFIAWYTSVPVEPALATSEPAQTKDTPSSDSTDLKDLSSLQDNVKVRSGWLTVRNTYEPTPPEGSGSYVNYVLTSYRSLTARNSNANASQASVGSQGDGKDRKERFFAVIKGTVLFLYEDEDMGEVWAALEMTKYDVSVWPNEGILDGELFAKRNAIVLKRRETGRDQSTSGAVTPSTNGDANDALAEPISSLTRKDSVQDALTLPYYIFVRANSPMEDWYHTLVSLSLPPPSSVLPLSPVFSPSDMSYLLSTIDSLPDLIPTRWLNALVGRLFFSFYHTAALEDFIISRMMRKLAKVKKPSFLRDIVVREVNLGDRPPILSKPMLKSLTKEGDAAVEVQVQWPGEVRITIEAVAVLSLGSKFRSYSVKLVLAAVFREMEGNLLIKIKPPPSNRLWYGFTAMPKMELDVQPVVSERQIKWSMILKPIESRLREIIQESVVFPNMDDIPFFDTRDMPLRGGLWADAARKEKYIIGLDGGPSVESSSRTEGEGLEPALIIGVGGDTAELAPPLAEGERLGRSSTIHSTQSAPAGHSKKSSWFGGSHKSRKDDRMSSLASGSASVVNSGSGGRTPDEMASVKEEVESKKWASDSNLPGAMPGLDTVDSSSSRERSAERSTMQSFEFPSVEGGEQLSPMPSGSSSRSSSMSATTTATSTARRTPPALPARRPTRTVSTGSTSTGYPSPPPWPSPPADGSGSPTPSNQSNTFLSTWKQRASDKQALQSSVTQAKDAMKKWGVNFAAKRRAGGGVVGSMFGTRKEGELDDDEEEEEERESQASVSPTASRRKPVNYEEISSSSALDSEGDNDTGSRSRTSSRPSSRPSSIKSLSTGAPGPSVTARYVTPSAPRTTTELSTAPPEEDPPLPVAPRRYSDNAVPISTAPNVPSTSFPPMARSAPSPIHVQPTSGMTMTVPGIHASHKGAIMSMGSSPPQPPPQPVPTPSKPVVETVYKLFKVGSREGQGAEVRPDGTSSAPPIETTSAVSPTSRNAPLLPVLQGSASLPPGPPTLPPRPVPPPPSVNTSRPVPAPPTLPPRRPPVSAPTTTTVTTADAGAASAAQTNAETGRPTSPTASESLRSFARRHSSRPSGDGSSTPTFGELGAAVPSTPPLIAEAQSQPSGDGYTRYAEEPSGFSASRSDAEPKIVVQPATPSNVTFASSDTDIHIPRTESPVHEDESDPLQADNVAQDL